MATLPLSIVASISCLLLLIPAGALPHRVLMPWACLEVCNSDSSINAYLSQLELNSSYFTDLSYESYILTPQGALASLNLTTNGTAVAAKLGLGAHPMVITAYIDRLRTLMHDPQPFIDAAVAAAQEHRYASFQLDFEPTSGALQNDSVAYGAFLVNFARALAPVNTDLLIAFDEWSPLWNLTVLRDTMLQTSNTYFAQMGTYNANFTWFTRRLHDALAAFGPDRLMVGLETVIDGGPGEGQNYTNAMLAPRFQALRDANVTRIGLWDLPVSEAWWPYLLDFAK